MPNEPRHIAHGLVIPSERYSDQPYIVRTDDGAWLCVLTTGSGTEGQAGQHVVTARSRDQGRTWSALVDVEPAAGPEASYAVLLKAPGGRVFCFYNHNTDNLREVIADEPPYAGGKCRRVDSQGHFVFKVSDDHGQSWSARRYEVAIRTMAIDRENPYGGAVRFFWNVGKAFVHEGAAFVPLHKVGGFGTGFFTRSEGVLLKSANLLTEPDLEHVQWETLPDGDAGLRMPPGGGPIAEEQSFSVLSDGSFYVVYRSVDGHPVCAYSRDGGHTWTAPEYQRYADGRRMKHPRAANFAWRCGNGRYLYWFHNHGGKGYEDRNPVWLCGGVEADTPQGKVIRWSQPEIVLYDDDPYIRLSYPDLVEEEGCYFLTETQKNIARVHEIDPSLLAGLWAQIEAPPAVAPDTLLALPAEGERMPAEVALPGLPRFSERDTRRADYGGKDRRTGVSLDMWLRLTSVAPGVVLLDNRDAVGAGVCLQTTTGGALEILLNDGRTACRWECDAGLLEGGRLHHVVVIVDGGPKVILFVVDGALGEGGTARQLGWGRFSPHLRDVNGSGRLRIAPEGGAEIVALRVYGRALRVSEAVAHFRAGDTEAV